MKRDKLQRGYVLDNIASTTLTAELVRKISNIDIKSLTLKKLKRQVINFSRVITKNFRKSDLNNFSNNLKTLRIESKLFMLKNFIFDTNIIGRYSVKKNTILIDYYDITLSIYHELFHMASSNIKNEDCGFVKKLDDYSNNKLGRAITEGYTELLTKRYFNYVGSCYLYEESIASALENIIGKDIMGSLYLNASFDGLVYELKKYAKDLDIYDFIYKVDFLSKNLKNETLYNNNKNYLICELKKVNEFLYKTYIEKLKIGLYNKSISRQEFFTYLYIYIENLRTSLRNGKYRYDYQIDHIEIQKILNEIFPNKDERILR